MLTETRNHMLKIFAGPGEKTVHVVSTGMTVNVKILCFWILHWHSALLSPALQTHTLGSGFCSQETAVVFLFVTVPDDRIQEGGTVPHNFFPDSMGSPEQQRVWTTPQFLELKVPTAVVASDQIIYWRQPTLSTSSQDTVCSTEISTMF